MTRELFVTSLKNTWKTCVKYYVSVFGVPIAIFPILSGIQSVTGYKLTDYFGISIWFSIILVLFGSIFVIIFIFTLFNTHAEQILLDKEDGDKLALTLIEYQKMQIELSKYFSLLNSIKRENYIFYESGVFNLGNPKREKYINAFTDELWSCIYKIVNVLKDGFSGMTGFECSVCVKMINQSDNPRDSFGEIINTIRCERSSNRTQFENKSKVKHFVNKNTAFNEIMEMRDTESIKMKDFFFLSNNLITENRYRNTSFEIYGGKPERDWTDEKKEQEWRLPYKAAIVTPICNMIPTNLTRTRNIVAFIGVDSQERDLFTIDHGLILLDIGERLYDVLNLRYTKIS